MGQGNIVSNSIAKFGFLIQHEIGWHGFAFNSTYAEMLVQIEITWKQKPTSKNIMELRNQLLMGSTSVRLNMYISSA